MLYFDLDGVLRDINYLVFGKEEPDKWDAVNNSGNDVITAVNKNRDILTRAPGTEYLKPVLDYIENYGKSLCLITCQPSAWRPYTEKWIERNISKRPYFSARPPIVYYTREPEAKLGLLSKNDYLVEDYPKFKTYEKIYLIDRQYNRNVRGERHRVRKPKDLIKIMEGKL